MVLLPAMVLQLVASLVANHYDRALVLDAARRDLATAAEQTEQLIATYVVGKDAELEAVLAQEALAQYVAYVWNEFDRDAERERGTLVASLRRLAATSRGVVRLELYDHIGTRIAAIGEAPRDPNDAPIATPAQLGLGPNDQRCLRKEDGDRLRLTRRVALEGRSGWTATASAVFDLALPARQAFAFATRHLPRAAGELAWDGAGPPLDLGGEEASGEAIVHELVVPELSGTIRLAQPAASALLLHREHRAVQGAAQALVTTALLGLIWLGISRTVLAPVARIGDQVRAFEQGAAPPPPPPHGRDALARLGATLDAAMRGWRDSTAELRQLTVTLEDRVRARSGELAASEERFQLAIRGANDAIWDWDITRDRIFYSPRWSEMLGLAGPADERPTAWHERVHPDDRPALEATIAAHLASPTAPFAHEHRVERADGSWCWVLARGQAVLGADGRPTRMAGSFSDVTDRRLAHERLREQAIVDPLTGLFNRRQLVDLIEREIAVARRYGLPLSVCMCDVDHFKTVNDVHGHRAGDDVLAALGRMIKAELRASDFAGRYGGDELGLAFPGTTAAHARSSVERIRTEIERATFANEAGTTFSVAASFGLAELDGERQGARDLMERADRGLYQAKRAGRNRTAIAAD